MNQLLAKSVRGGRALTLQQHLDDTEVAAAELFRTGTRWASAFLRFFRLSLADHPRFLLNLRIAALLHDLGKANSGFQRAVTAAQFTAQPYRHEHLSALLLVTPQVRTWLGQASGVDVDVVTAAVLGHHLKAEEHGERQVLAAATRGAITLNLQAVDVTATLARVAELAGIAPLQVGLPDGFSLENPVWRAEADRLFEYAATFASKTKVDTPRRALCLAMKAGLIAADSVASATFREQLPIKPWLDGVAHRPAIQAGDVNRDILERRIAELGNPNFQYHEFQNGAARLGRRGLLLAGCGAGKTLAAWRWAEAIAASEPIGRVIFLYPTRGTATEGFRDYVGHAPEGTAALAHGSAAYELAAMAANPEEQPASLRNKTILPDEIEDRLFALGLWGKRYFSATVDQFLGFVENQYRGLCLLPALADSAVILDEVHSYDRSMWRSLLAFLRHFDVPVLCMTATMPAERRHELEALGLAIYPLERDRADLADLELRECLPRYQQVAVAGADEALVLVRAAVAEGLRVLWVVNTVVRCQDLAQRLGAELAREVTVYHSRFTLEDRKGRHQATIAAFRPGAHNAAVAVSTQVCEMSLDLDADVLVTEHAPVPSLVQRFGRAHRHGRSGRPPARLVTYAPEGPLPYTKDDLVHAARFLAALGGEPASQRRMAELMLEVLPAAPAAADWAKFTTGGYFASPGALRDEDGVATQAVLDSDVERFLSMRRRGEATDGLLLSVPKNLAVPDPTERLPPWLRVARHEHYHPLLGYLGRRERNQ